MPLEKHLITDQNLPGFRAVMDYSDSEADRDIADDLVVSDDNKSGRSREKETTPHRNGAHHDAESEDDFDGFIATLQSASNRRAANMKGTGLKKGGGFQSMGLDGNILKAITKKGFKVPTPIQRKAIPMLLDGKDVVGMARTGSGKTAAFVVPLIQKLKEHSVKIGVRALILSPSRELALQTLLVVKELGKGTELRSVLLVGGESMDHQFAAMTANPDIVIATPGRFVHLKVEMGLELSTIKYVVFDEADRLFEMGFAAQLHEILHALPPSRQTSLFSATLPKTLVEFARAGLQEPELIRLDAESKVSPDLQSAFFTVGSADKAASLLHLLHNIIKIPTGPTDNSLRKTSDRSEKAGDKRKRENKVERAHIGLPTAHSTIVFAATKHHVEYLAELLRQSGYPVSAVYGSLDQTARSMQVEAFREGLVHILVVTDVAARGIDIPILAHVVNYDFPTQPKVFVHRVGRTARAGQMGSCHSLVTEGDLPYLLDLQLFLGRNLQFGTAARGADNKEEMIVGSIPRTGVDTWAEWLEQQLQQFADLSAMKGVAIKAEKQYNRTRSAAAMESVRRAKKLVDAGRWLELHQMFEYESLDADREKEKMLQIVSGFKPKETVFEVGMKGKSDETNEAVRRTRERIAKGKIRGPVREDALPEERLEQDLTKRNPPDSVIRGDDSGVRREDDDGSGDQSSDDEFEVTLTAPAEDQASDSADEQASSYYMSYTPSSQNPFEDRGYGVHSGGNSKPTSSSNFAEAARSATMDLNTDEAGNNKLFAQPSKMRWDKRSKKYVNRANDEDGSRGTKFITGEGGQKIAASFKSGVFDRWRKSNRIERLPRAGEVENKSSMARARNAGAPLGKGGNRLQHFKERTPKAPDRFRDDYHKQKKKADAAREAGVEVSKAAAIARKVGGGHGRDARGRRMKGEVKSVSEIHKARGEKDRRRAKTGRPSKVGKGKGRR